MKWGEPIQAVSTDSLTTKRKSTCIKLLQQIGFIPFPDIRLDAYAASVAIIHLQEYSYIYFCHWGSNQITLNVTMVEASFFSSMPCKQALFAYFLYMKLVIWDKPTLHQDHDSKSHPLSIYFLLFLLFFQYQVNVSLNRSGFEPSIPQ